MDSTLPTIQIAALFPIAVGVSKLERNFTEEELQFFEDSSKKRKPNQGNSTSHNFRVLHEKEMADLGKFIIKSIKSYLDQSNPLNFKELDIYITQSWLNYSEPKEYHHAHGHPNSFLSGVFYINAKIDVDKIYFINSHDPQIRVYPSKWTPFNSREWSIPVETGMLVLFPSHLRHRVDINESTHCRVSLSFNTFFKGTVGSSEDLTELIL